MENREALLLDIHQEISVHGTTEPNGEHHVLVNLTIPSAAISEDLAKGIGEALAKALPDVITGVIRKWDGGIIETIIEKQGQPKTLALPWPKRVAEA